MSEEFDLKEYIRLSREGEGQESARSKFSGWNASYDYAKLLVNVLQDMKTFIYKGDVNSWIINLMTYHTYTFAFVEQDNAKVLWDELIKVQKDWNMLNGKSFNKVDPALKSQIYLQLFDINRKLMVESSHLIWRTNEDADDDFGNMIDD